MTSPAGQAKLEIIGDASKFAAQLERDANRQLRQVDLNLTPIAKQITAGVEKAVAGTEQAFNELGRPAERAFAELARDADRAMGLVEEDARETGAAIGETIARGSEVAETSVRELARTADKAFDAVQRQAREAGVAVGTSMASAFSYAKVTAITAGVAITAGLVAITKFGLTTAASLEQTNIGFTALLGSAEEAGKFMKELQTFAAATPFEFQGVADASRRILAFGAAVGIAKDQVIPTITVIGDLASVLGVGQQEIDSVVRALGQMASKGKISQEELLQLAEALPGFNANAAIASALGLTVAESMKKITAGEVDAKTGIDALLKGMQQFPGAAGAMELQAQTLLGVFSTFKDTIGQALAGAFEPVIPTIKDSLAQLTPILGAAVGELAPALGNLLSGVLPLVGGLVQGLVPILAPILNGLTAGLAAIGPSLQPLGEAIGVVFSTLQPLLPLLGTIIAALATGLTPIILSLAPILSVIGDLVIAVFEPLAPLIVQIGQTIGFLIAPLGDFLASMSDILPVTSQLVKLLVDALGPVLLSILPLVGGLSEVFISLAPALLQLAPPIVDVVIALLPLVDLLVALIDVLIPILNPILKLAAALVSFLATKAIVPLIQAIADGLTFILSPLLKLTGPLEDLGDFLRELDWGKVGEGIVHGLGVALDAAGEFFVNLGTWFRELPFKILGFLATLPGKLRDFLVFAIKSAFDGMLKLIGVGIGLIVFQFTTLPGLIVDALKDFAAFSGRVFIDAFNWLAQKTREFVDSTIAFFKALPGRMVDALVNLAQLTGQVFTTAFAWIKTQVSNKIAEIVDLVTGLPGRLVAIGGKLLEAGRTLISKLFDGFSSAGGFVGDLGNSIVAKLKSLINGVIDKINDGIAGVDKVLPGDLPRIPRLSVGGVTQQEGIALLHPSEAVLPLESDRVRGLLADALSEAQSRVPTQRGPSSEQLGDVHIQVFVGDREITDIVDVRVSESNRNLRRRVTAGGRRR